MFKQELIIQSSNNAGEIFDSLMNTAVSIEFSEFEILMAYASYRGCYLFHEELTKRFAGWSKVKKRWLISIDGGVTEPKALKFLRDLNNSEVKIPHAKEILARNLRPKTLFHHKLYLFDAPMKKSLAIYTGSPNLTASGLYTNNEQATSIICHPRYTTEDEEKFLLTYKIKSIIQKLYEEAELLNDEILKKYEEKAKRPKFNREDDNEISEKIAEENAVIPITQGIALATSNNLWVEIKTEISNYHVGNKGSQLDLQRGVRTFFGFNSNNVPTNTIFGSIRLKYQNNYYDGTLKFGNNQMDKLNLPPCDNPGPTTYVNQTVLFERKSNGVFELKIGTASDKKRWKSLSEKQGTLFELRSGRKFGVFR